MRGYSRAELLDLTASRYLSQGFTEAGAPRPELTADYATAAATQLLAAQVSAQELSLTAEALAQVLAMHDEAAPAARLAATVTEALAVVAGAIRQANNPGLAAWLAECASSVKSQADMDAFLAHLAAVNRQYAVLAALQPQL